MSSHVFSHRFSWAPARLPDPGRERLFGWRMGVGGYSFLQVCLDQRTQGRWAVGIVGWKLLGASREFNCKILCSGASLNKDCTDRSKKDCVWHLSLKSPKFDESPLQDLLNTSSRTYSRPYGQSVQGPLIYRLRQKFQHCFILQCG